MNEKFRRIWSIWSLSLIIVIGVVFAGISITNYFQANAASKPMNQPKTEIAEHPVMKKAKPDVSKQKIRDERQDKEWIPKQQDQALARENVKEIRKVPSKTTQDTAAAPSATKDKATPPPVKKESKTIVSEHKVNKSGRDEPKNKVVYLTFDDGPSPFSGDIIELLDKHHFKATFFMIDGNIRRFPEAAKLMVKSGEAVGLHSVSHDVKRFYASVHSVLGELEQNRNTLKEISGVDSYLIRTPYGSVPRMTPKYRKAVIEKGYSMWDWNIDSKDWYFKDGRYVTSVIEQLRRIEHHQEPIVILLHERKETLANLPKLLDFLTKNGYKSHAINSSMTPFQFKQK